MKIHPTAIIDSGAELHESVEIGPYSIIEKDVKIGEGTIIESSCRIYNGTRIGKFNKISHNNTLGNLPQDVSFEPETKTYLEIGDGNTLRENVVIHRASKEGKSTKLGNHNFIMCQIHLGHDVELEDHIIVVPGTVIGGHVKIASRAFVSGLVAFHQFTRVGEYAMVAGCSKIVQDIPPFCTADGNPADMVGLNVVGLKRAGFSPDVRAEIKKAYKLIYSPGKPRLQILGELKQDPKTGNEVKKIIEFIEQSDRGIISTRRTKGSSEE